LSLPDSTIWDRNLGTAAASLERGGTHGTPRAKVVTGHSYASARGIRPGINAGKLDLAQLQAIPIEYRSWLPGKIDAFIEDAKAKNDWLIFFTHDVSNDPSPFGCTPAMLEHVLKRLTDEAIDILPVTRAMARAVFGPG